MAAVTLLGAATLTCNFTPTGGCAGLDRLFWLLGAVIWALGAVPIALIWALTKPSRW